MTRIEGGRESIADPQHHETGGAMFEECCNVEVRRRSRRVLENSRLLAIIVGVSTIIAGPCPMSMAESVDKLIENVLKADNYYAKSSYRALFKRVGNDLPILLRSRFDSIAIQAAWEDVNLNPRYTFSREKEVDAKMLDWFLGFFEGRTRTTAPKWWAESVGQAQFVDDRVLATLPLGKEYDPKGRAPFATPEGTTISKTDGGYRLQIGNDSIVLSRELALLASFAMPEGTTISKTADGYLLKTGKESIVIPNVA